MSETKRRLTREEIAAIEVGHTEVSKAQRWVLCLLLMLTILTVPVVQAIREMGLYEEGKRQELLPQSTQVMGELYHAALRGAGNRQQTLDAVFAANSHMLRTINTWEDDLEDESLLSRYLLSPSQYLLCKYTGAGNEEAYLGRDGWLFYRPGVEYVSGPGFLEPDQLHKRSLAGNEWQPAPQPDPRKAILQFRDQLASREIELIVFPTPVKPQVHPARFTSRYSNRPELLQNASWDAFIADLESAGVNVYQPDELLERLKANRDEALYLATDTHWRPETMQAVAADLAAFITDRTDLRTGTTAYTRGEETLSNLGDIAGMLKLPSDQDLYAPETVTVRPVLQPNGALWQPSREAGVLLLGDSFSNIYSLEAMKWGRAAGFAEQLACELQQPIDTITQNDQGSFVTRQSLSRELAKGRNRLAGKKVLVWQFAARELVVGDWKLLPMELGEAVESDCYVPPAGQSVQATATVASVSFIPQPGTVPYKDHIFAVHLVDLSTDDGEVTDGQAVGYFWSMREGKLQPASLLRPGREVTVRLEDWMDKADLEGIKRSELSSEDLAFADPCWAELIVEEAPAETVVAERDATLGKLISVLIGLTGLAVVCLTLHRGDRAAAMEAASAPHNNEPSTTSEKDV